MPDKESPENLHRDIRKANVERRKQQTLDNSLSFHQVELQHSLRKLEACELLQPTLAAHERGWLDQQEAALNGTTTTKERSAIRDAVSALIYKTVSLLRSRGHRGSEIARALGVSGEHTRELLDRWDRISQMRRVKTDARTKYYKYGWEE